MDLHRLRVVEFDTLVSEEEGEKKSIAELEESKQKECNDIRSDDKNDKTNELGSDDKYVDDGINPTGSSIKSYFTKRKSKSEIFRNPSKNKLKNRDLKINSSFEDLSKSAKDSAHSNGKKRTLNLFSRKSSGDQNEEDIKTKKDRRKKKEDIHFVFARETPSFIRYSRKRAKNEGKRDNHDFNSHDIFGFKNNQSAHPYLYQMSCNYLNLDKFPFKNITKGFRRNNPTTQPVSDCFCKHHAMRVLNSTNTTSGDNGENSSIYYNLSAHSHPHRARRGQDHVHYEESWRRDPPCYMAKDETVSVSPSSLLPLKKCCCDACVGPSKARVASHSHRHPPTHHDPPATHHVPPATYQVPPATHHVPPGTHHVPPGMHHDPPATHHVPPCMHYDPPASCPKPPCPRYHRPGPKHSTPSPSCAGNAPAYNKPQVVICTKKQMNSVLNNQRNRLFAGFFQNVTAFHTKNWPSGKNIIKYGLFGLLIVVWSPCLLAVILAWVVMCPVKLTNMCHDKTKRIPIMNSFMNRFRKKGPGSEYQRIRCGNYSCPKNRNIMTSAVSWYARAAGTVGNTFHAMLSLLKVRNNAPTCAGSSFLTSTHPNPRKRYTLFYADNRGWMMKPARRSHTRSCASTRVMRCEFRPKFWQKSTHEQKFSQTKMGQSGRNVNYGRPMHGVFGRSNTARQRSSPAGDAACGCPDMMSYSGNRISPSKLNIARKNRTGSAMFMPVASHRLPSQQVNISTKHILEMSGIASNSSKYTSQIKPKNFNSSYIAEKSQKKYPQYIYTQRKNGTLPFGLVLDCACGTKHPLITNRQINRTHNFGLAGKTLNMTAKHAPKYKEKGVQGQSTKYKPKTTKKKSPDTKRTGFTDKKKTSHESNGSQEQSTHRIALNCPCGAKRRPTIADTKLHRTNKTDLTDKTQKQVTTDREYLRTRNRRVLANLSKSALTNQAGTSTYKIDLTDKTTSFDAEASPGAPSVECACKYKSTTSKDLPKKSSPLNKGAIDCSCGNEKQLNTQKTSECACKFELSASNREKVHPEQPITHKIAIDCGCGAEKQSSINAVKHPANDLKKQSPRIEKECQCACKESGGTHPASDKILIECGCRTEKHLSAIDKAINCPCRTMHQPKIDIGTLAKTSQKQPRPEPVMHKTVIDCGCGSQKQANVIKKQSPRNEKASQCACKESVTKKQSPRDEKASQCTCKECVPKKQSTQNEKATQCACKESVPKKQSTQYEKASQCACKESDPKKQSPQNEKASQCACKESDTKKQSPQNEKASQCACKESDPKKQSPRNEKASQCACKESDFKKQSPRNERASQCACKESDRTKAKKVGAGKSEPDKKNIECGCMTERQSSDKAINCPCRSMHQASRMDIGTFARTSQKQLRPEPVMHKIVIDCGCGSQKLSSIIANDLKKQSPRNEKASQCACRESDTANAKKIRVKKFEADNKIIECGCGIDIIPSITAAAPECACKSEKKITIDCSCGTETLPSTVVAKKISKQQVTGIEKAAQYEQSADRKDTMQQTQAESKKETTDCACGTESIEYGIALNCPCGSKHQPSTAFRKTILSLANKPFQKSSIKFNQKSGRIFERPSYNYGIALNCPCGTKEQATSPLIPPPSTGSQTSTTVTPPSKPQIKVAEKRVPSIQRVPECACKAEKKLTIDCSCGTESTAVAKKPPKQQADNLKKHSPRIEKASQCACKTQNKSNIETGQIKKTSNIKAVDCSCWTETQPRTAAAKKPAKNQKYTTKQKVPSVIKCACKNAPSTSQKIAAHPKQSASVKKTIDCGCGAETQRSPTNKYRDCPCIGQITTAGRESFPTRPLVLKKSSTAQTYTPGRTLDRKILPNNRSVYADIPQTLSKQVPSPQSFGIASDCVCEKNEDIGVDGKSHKTSVAEHSPSQQPKFSQAQSQTSHQFPPPVFGIASDCDCKLNEAIPTDKNKHKTSLAEYPPAHQIKPSKKQPQSFGIASDCACKIYEPIQTDKSKYKTSIAEYPPGHQKKHSKDEPPSFGIASDCACGASQPIAIEKKSSYIDKRSLTGYSSTQQIKATQEQSLTFGIASDCACQTDDPFATDENTGSIRQLPSHLVEPSQPHTHTSQHTHAFQKHTQTPQPYAHTSQPHTHTSQPYTQTPQPHTHTPQPHTHTSQKHESSFGIASDCACQTDDTIPTDESSTTDKTDLVDQELSKQIKFSQTPSIKKESSAFADPRKTGLGKHSSRQHTKSSQTSQKRPSIKIASKIYRKTHHTQTSAKEYSTSQRVKSSQTKLKTRTQDTKYENIITSYKKRAIDCINRTKKHLSKETPTKYNSGQIKLPCQHLKKKSSNYHTASKSDTKSHHPRKSQTAELPSHPRMNAPKHRIPSLERASKCSCYKSKIKQPPSFKRVHECTCSSIRSSKSISSRRASVLKLTQGTSPQNSLCRRIDCICSVKKNQFPSVQTSYRARKIIQADKSRVLGRNIHQRPQISKPQTSQRHPLSISSTCCCLPEEEKKTPFSTKADKSDVKVSRDTARQSSFKSLITSECPCSVNPPSSSQIISSIISGNSSKVSKLVMKLHSKLFSRKISKKKQITPAQSPIPLFSSPIKCPCDNTSSSHLKAIQEDNIFHRSPSQRSISQSVYSSHTKCPCPVHKTSTTQITPQNASVHTRKSILVDKSYQSLSQRSQISKRSQRPSFQIYSSHSKCRCPVPSTSSKFSSGKKSPHIRKPIRVDKSYSCSSRRSISRLSKTSQRSSFPSYSSAMECRCLVDDTSHHSLRKTSPYSSKSMVDKYYPRLSQRCISRQLKPSHHSSIVMSVVPIKCTCSSGETSSTQDEEKLGHLGKKTKLKPNQRNKMSQFSSIFSRFHSKPSAQKLLDNSHPSLTGTKQNEDLRLSGQHTTITQNPSSSDYNQRTSAISDDKHRFPSDQVSYIPRKTTLEKDTPSGFSQHLKSLQPDISKYSRRFSSQQTRSVDKRLISDPASYHPHKTTIGTDAPSAYSQHIPSQQTGISKKSRHFSSHTTPSVDKQRLISDSAPHHPRKSTIGTDAPSAYSQHLPSQQTGISKKPHHFISHTTPPADKPRLISDPESHHPRKTTIGTDAPPAYSQHLPSHQTGISKKTRHLSSHAKPSTQKKRLTSDPVSHVPRKTTMKSDGPPAYSQHLPSQQPDISKYSPHSSSQPTQSVAERRLISDPASQDPHKTTLGTDALAGFPHHLSSQQPESSKYSRHISSQPTPSVDKQRLISDPTSHHPRRTNIGAEEHPAHSQHIPSHQPEVSKYSRHFSSQHTPSGENQHLSMDQTLHHPRRTTMGTEEHPAHSQHIPSHQPEVSKYSRHFSSQHTPSGENQHLSMDQTLHHPRRTTMGTEEHPAHSQHIPSHQPEVSKHSRHFSSQQTPSGENELLPSGPILHHPRNNAMGTEDYSRFSHLPNQEAQMPKRLSLAHRSQPKSLAEKLRLISDKLSLRSRKNGQEKISSSHSVQTPSIIPGKCACLSEKLHKLSEKISQYSQRSILEKKLQPDELGKVESNRPTASAEKQRLQSEQLSHHPRKTTLGPEEDSHHFPSQYPDISKYSPHSSSQPTQSVAERRLISDPASQDPHKTTLGTDALAGFPHHLSSQQPESSKYSRHISSQPTPSVDKQRLISDPTSHHPRRTNIGPEEHPAHSQHIPSHQPEVSKYSRHFSSQQTPSGENQHLSVDPTSHHPRRTTMGTEEHPAHSQHVPSHQPEVSKYSRHFSSQPTSSVDKQRLISDPTSHHPRRTNIGTEEHPAHSQHIPSHQPEVSKYSRHFSSQQTPSGENQHLSVDPTSHHPRRTTMGTEEHPAHSQHVPSHQPEVSKYSRHFSSQQTPPAENQQISIDPTSHHPRRTTMGTDEHPAHSQHIPSHQPEVSKYSRHFSSQQTPSAENQHLSIDPTSHHPRRTTMGTEEHPAHSQHIPSHQPEVSKYSRHFSSQQTPPAENQQISIDPTSHHPRRTAMGAEEHPAHSQHIPSHQPDISKYSPHSSSQPTPSVAERRLISDPGSHDPHKTRLGSDALAGFPHHLPSQHREISNNSSHSHAQPTPSSEKQRLPSDQISHLQRKATLENEGEPELLQHFPSQQPDVSKRSSLDRHSQPKRLTEKLRKLSDIVSQQTPQTEQEKISPDKLTKHYPNLQNEMYPHPLDPFRPIIPIIPGSCTCAAKRRLQLEHSRKTLLENKSQENIELQHLPRDEHETPHLHSLQPSPSAEKLRLLSDPVSEHHRKKTLESQVPGFPYHIKSQDPEISKYSRQISSQPNPSAEKLRLLSDPVSQQPRKTTLGHEGIPGFPYHLPSQDPETTKYSRHISSQTTPSAEKLHLLSEPVLQHPRKTTLGNEELPGFPHHFSSQHPENSEQSPQQQTPLAEKAHVHPDSMWHFPRKTIRGTEESPGFSRHLESQPPKISAEEKRLTQLHKTKEPSEYSQHLPSQQHGISDYLPQLRNIHPTPSFDKQHLSDPVSHLPRESARENERQLEFLHYPNQQLEISKRSSLFRHSQPKRVTEKLQKTSDIIFQHTPESEQSWQQLTEYHPSQEASKHSYYLDSSETTPIIPGKCSCKEKRQHQSDTSSKTTLNDKSQKSSTENNYNLQRFPIHQPTFTCENSPHLHSFQPIVSAEKEQRLSDAVTQHPRKTTKGTNDFGKFPHHLPNLEPEISKHARHYGLQVTSSTDKQRLSSDSESHKPRKTTLRTELQPRFFEHFPTQQQKVAQNSPTRIISGKCTCSVNKHRIPREVVPIYNLQNTSSESETPEMSDRPPSLQYSQQSHSLFSGICTCFTKKKISPDKVSDYSCKKGHIKKLLGLSQQVTVQRSELNQNPPSPLSKLMSAVFSPNSCECRNNELQTLKKKISHVSRVQTVTATVDKPPPGLLQRRSSGQVRKGSADYGQQPAIPPQKSPYPDFNRVSMRYPGRISEPKRSEQFPGPIKSEPIPALKRSERIPAPANYYYPPAVGVSPPPKYARFPCFINPANKCGPKTCSDEFALRRAYKRRPLRYIPPKQQLIPRKTPKQLKKMKKAEAKKKKKKKKKQSGSKLTQCCRCVRDLVYEAEKEAWPTDVTCSPMYVHALKRKPCFWIFECCPSMYPTFLNCFKFQENVCQLCMYLLTICFWCPLIVCVYFCCDVICRGG